MAEAETHDQAAPRFTWRSLAGLFGEAWHREQRRRRRWLLALAVLIAAGVLIVALTGAGRNKPGGPDANVALSTKPNAGGGRALPAATHVGFAPQAVDKPIPVGLTRTFKVQLLGHLNKPVQRAGIPVWLNQIIYSATGVHRGWAIINGKSVRHPDVALTNAQGVATFAITGTRPSVLPTALEAHLLHKPVLHKTATYGASGYLLIRFSAHSH